MGNLGLLFTISADPTQAQAAFQALNAQFSALPAQVQRSTVQAAAAFSDVKDEFASSAAAAQAFTNQVSQSFGQKLPLSMEKAHEGARLLEVMLGTRLPRAVSTAVGTMVPEIGTMMNLFLAGFAVEKVFEWGKAGLEAVHNMYSEASDDIKSINSAAAAAFKQMGDEATQMLTHFKTPEAGAMSEAVIDARMKQLVEYHNAFMKWSKDGEGNVRDLSAQTAQTIAAIAAAKKEGLNAVGDVDKKIAELGAMQFDAHQQMAKVTAQADKALCDVAKKDLEDTARAAQQAEAIVRKFWEAEKQIADWRMRAMMGAGKQHKEDVSDAETSAQRAQDAKDFIQKQQLLDLEIKLANVRTLTYGDLRKLEPEVKQLANATVHLSQAQTMQIAVLQKIHQNADAAKQSLGGMASATIQAGVAAAISGQNIAKAMEQALKGTLTSIASEAAVRALYNVGLGIYYEAIHDYPDADLAFSAAAVFGSVAGATGAAAAAIPGGGGRSGGGAGSSSHTGGNQSNYNQGGGPGGSGPGGGGSGPGAGATIIWHQYGPTGNMADFARIFSGVQNQLAGTGQIKVVATNGRNGQSL